MRNVALVIGWTLRASAAICIVYVGIQTATGGEGFTTLAGVLSAAGFHAVCAVAGTQLVGLARRAETPAVRGAEA